MVQPSIDKVYELKWPVTVAPQNPFSNQEKKSKTKQALDTSYESCVQNQEFGA